MQCTIAGGQRKGANDRSFVLVQQHGSDDETWKPPIHVKLILVVIDNIPLSLC